MLTFIFRVCLCLLTIAGTLVVTDLLGSSSLLPAVFMLFGSISIFFGPLLTGSGFFYGGKYVSTPTPYKLWKILGWLLWMAGAVSLIVISLR